MEHQPHPCVDGEDMDNKALVKIVHQNEEGVPESCTTLVKKEVKTEVEDTSYFESSEVNGMFYKTADDDTYPPCDESESTNGLTGQEALNPSRDGDMKPCLRTVNVSSAVAENIDSTVLEAVREKMCNKIFGDKRFSCSMCSRHFSSNRKMLEHVDRVHVGDRPHVCTVCDFRTKTKSDMNKHMRSHNDHKPFKCGDCGKLFKVSYSLERHSKVHSGERAFECDECKKSFVTDYELRKHYRRVHMREKNHECDVCGMRFFSHQVLERHILTHSSTRVKPYVCAVCSKRFIRRDRMKKHASKCVKVQDDDVNVDVDELKFKCEICCKAFSSSTALKKHKRLHVPVPGFVSLDPLSYHSVNDAAAAGSSSDANLKTISDKTKKGKLFRCNFCHKCFLTRSVFKNHLITHVSSDRPFKCSVCDKSFRKRYMLLVHDRCHSGEKPHKCQFCEKAFALRAMMNKHMKIHRNERPYLCNACGKSFNHSNTLRRHVRMHTGEMPYKCHVCEEAFSGLDNLKFHLIVKNHLDGLDPDRADKIRKSRQCQICGKVYVRTPNLRIHMSMHRGEKIYYCKCCDRSFMSHVGLLIHERSIHTNERPYPCTICQKTFVLPSKLKAHMRSHSHERPFVCSVCGASFRYNASLKFHTQRHTGERPYGEKQCRCEICDKLYSTRVCLKRHQLIHQKKPYRCRTCGKSFAKENVLKSHLDQHENQSALSCQICKKIFTRLKDLKRHVTRVHEKPDRQSVGLLAPG